MRGASAAARTEFERLGAVELARAMDGEGPRAVFWNLLDPPDKASLRRALHTLDGAWDGVRRERRVIEDLLAPKATPPSDSSVLTAQTYWRRVYSDAANSGHMPTTAKQAEAVCGLLQRLCAVCGAREDDKIGGSVETVREAARSIRQAGNGFWPARNPPPAAGGTVEEAAAWWHAFSVRFCRFDLPAALVAAGEADSLSEADQRLRGAADAAMAAGGSGDPELDKVAGKDWRIFLVTLEVVARLQALTKAGLGGRRLGCAASDLKAVLAALDRLEAGMAGRPGALRKPAAQDRRQPQGRQVGAANGSPGQEERKTVKRTPASSRSKRPQQGFLAWFRVAVRRWLGLPSS